MIIAMVLTTIFSFRHINKHSKSIERLGVKTNSTVMNLYVLFWFSFGAEIILNIVMYRLRTDALEDGYIETALNYQIVYAILYAPQWLLAAGLDILVLFAYFRLCKKLSAEVSELVTESLRDSSGTSSRVSRGLSLAQTMG
mmetsp:Transcript_1235/g.1627  ORF Transcript_1235/g.1627 Transcript_1235/m.1627 type:complete len:141 (+) Transcript_1235:559-981(+)|eukprot:CAMPEP_0185576196 /NCGR_PEP_ID=MMETSP0434-20130131/7177_1 /TAXON_ID=626734 ORGANISM="Favella taraikaensis, Strain Fe Narragansett Bay" /NCGR_SAMPLE_ID=MMETSP0434 /ASSEMBLY_ACC=CAM_ASM_000379 /LENGTH=140 /DNA_ID=CAMNT_0028193299 /DNA_START=559 /DNA_END=981 /DNA_ORIENTATION=-